MKKIIVSGCSYSEHNDYPNNLSHKTKIPLLNMATSGNSNDKIIKNIYDVILSKDEDIENCLFICQLTYLHRIGFHHSFNDQWIDYQPSFLYDRPIIKNNNVEFPIVKKIKNNNLENKLKDMYETYLSFIYDDDKNFDRMIQQVDFLESFVEKNKSKILFIYWPSIINDRQLNEIKKRSFFKIKEEYSMLDYTVKSNLIEKDDSHLSAKGSIIFSDILSKHYFFDKLK